MFQIVLQPSAPAAPLETPSEGVLDAVGMIVVVCVAGIVCALLVAGVIRKSKRPTLDGLTPEKVRLLWKQIEQSAKQGPMGQKIAIIEADKLVDNVLKSMLVPGETMGERLKMAGHTHRQLRDVWPAHRVRNRLVHETDYVLQEGEVKHALEGFRRALQTLHVL